jgi:hypothetical protein
VSTFSRGPGVFSSLKRMRSHEERGPLWLCDRWLVRPSFLPPRRSVRWTLIRSPLDRPVVWSRGKRLSISIDHPRTIDRRTVQLSRSPVPARTESHGFAQGPHSVPPLRTSGNSRPDDRQKGNGNQLRELVRTVHFAVHLVGDVPCIQAHHRRYDHFSDDVIDGSVPDRRLVRVRHLESPTFRAHPRSGR